MDSAGRLSLRQTFEEATACLSPHQMIASSKLNLVRSLSSPFPLCMCLEAQECCQQQEQAVSAVEIMDPQADLGLFHEIDANFEATRALSPEQLLAVLDRLFQAEMTWHTGHDLAQTVFTCLYTLHLDQIASIPTSSSVPDNEHEPPPELLSLVLHSYILGTFKCIELAMQEYARGNVREQEDISTLTNGQDIASEVPVQRAVDELSDAWNWLMSYAQDRPSPLYDALLARLALRSGFLVSLAVTFDTTLESCNSPNSEPDAHISSSREALDIIGRQPHYVDHQCEQISVAFDPLVARVLPQSSPCPLRHVVFLDWEQSCNMMRELLDGMRDAWDITTLQGWVQWMNRFKSLARQDRPSLARSLVASTFFSEPLHTVASRSDYDLQRLARSFAIHIGGIGQEALDEWKKEESQVTRWWLSKLAGQLVNYTFVLSQNRPRQQRKLLESLKQWQILVDDLARTPFNAKVTLPLKHACRFTMADMALEGYLAGLHIDLYDVFCEEGITILWTVSKLARCKLNYVDNLSSRLSLTGQSPSIHWMQREARVCSRIAHLAETCFKICVSQHASRAIEERSVETRQMYFDLRLGDLQKLDLRECSFTWDDLQVSLEAAGQVDAQEMITVARRTIEPASTTLDVSPSILEQFQNLLGGMSVLKDLLADENRSDAMVMMLEEKLSSVLERARDGDL